MTDGDALLAVLPELRDVGRDRFVQCKLPLFEQHHDRRRRHHDLGQRGHIEDRVGCHRLRRRHDRTATEGLLIQRAVWAPDEHDRTRQPLLRHRIRDERLQAFEALGRAFGHARPSGADLGQDGC
jgi:hypothetical protein